VAIPFDGTHDPQEQLLQQVLSLIPRTAESVQVSVQPRTEPIDKFVEGVGVPGLGTPDELDQRIFVHFRNRVS
jgi:hypothetical protein